jgi:hypothetical protein
VAMAERRRACGHYLGDLDRHCRQVGQVRLYLTGWRCPAHTSPAALVGEPEPGTPRGSTPTSAAASPCLRIVMEMTS